MTHDRRTASVITAFHPSMPIGIEEVDALNETFRFRRFRDIHVVNAHAHEHSSRVARCSRCLAPGVSEQEGRRRTAGSCDARGRSDVHG